MTLYPGKIIVISGPSGVGKGTLIQQLLGQFPQAHLAVSATTRAPREGEINHSSYHFLSQEQFQSEIDSGAFLEWCKVHDHFYGTLSSELKAAEQPDGIVILEIDVQGAKKVKAKVPSIQTLFIAPPSLDELKSRLLGRKTEPQDVIERRLKTAIEEMGSQNWYDCVIINRTIEDSMVDLIAFFKENPHVIRPK